MFPLPSQQLEAPCFEHLQQLDHLPRQLDHQWILSVGDDDDVVLCLLVVVLVTDGFAVVSVGRSVDVEPSVMLYGVALLLMAPLNFHCPICSVMYCVMKAVDR